MKHTTFFYLVATAFVLVGATACSSGDDGDEQANPTPTNPTERKLIIGASANPWLDENGNARETRGQVITTETLQQFLMDWYQSEDFRCQYNVKRGNDSKWTATPDNWPIVNVDGSVSFYAHTSGSFIYNGGNSYISFTAEEGFADLHDLLVSKITDVTNSGTGGVIWFTFDHACAAVEFNIQITNKLYKQIKSALTVNSVKLMHIAKTGDYNYSTGWENVGVGDPGYTDYTLTTSDITVSTEPQPLLPGNTLFIIPQKLGADTKLEITYTLSGQEKKTEIPLKEADKDTEWKAGHLYPINIVLGTTYIQYTQ